MAKNTVSARRGEAIAAGMRHWDAVKWTRAISRAKAGDLKLLERLLRSTAPADREIPNEVRNAIMVLLKDSRQPRARGVRSRVKLDADLIRNFYEILVSIGFTKERAREKCAAEWHVSPGNIRDVIERRKTFAEK